MYINSQLLIIHRKNTIKIITGINSTFYLQAYVSWESSSMDNHTLKYVLVVCLFVCFLFVCFWSFLYVFSLFCFVFVFLCFCLLLIFFFLLFLFVCFLLRYLESERRQITSLQGKPKQLIWWSSEFITKIWPFDVVWFLRIHSSLSCQLTLHNFPLGT